MIPINKIHTIPFSTLLADFLEQKIPSDIIKLIFSYLTPSQLIPVSLVNKRWRRLATSAIPKISLNVIDDFRPFLLKGIIKTPELVKFARLSSFISSCKQENDSQHDIRAPQPYVSYGKMNFRIIHNDQIQVSGNHQEIILKDPLKREIAFLEVEGDYVFALTQSGEVIQWNYRTQTIVQTLETAYSKKHPDLKEFWERNRSFHSAHCFYVDKDIVLLKYGMATTRTVEIIPYQKSEMNRLVTLPSNCYPSCIKRVNNHLFFLNRNSILIAEMCPLTFNFLKYKTISIEMNVSHFLFDIAVANNILYSHATDHCFYVMDVASNRELAKLNVKDSPHFVKIEVVDNLILAFESNYRATSRIHVYDLCSKKFIKIFDLDNHLLENLINFIREHRQANPFSRSGDQIIPDKNTGCRVM